MKVWQTHPEGIEEAADALRAGRLVGMPTETVYGLAGDAWNPAALADIFAVKGRPTFDPLIVHAPSREEAFALASFVPPDAIRLAERFWPGPLTLVLPRLPQLPDLLSAGLDTVGLRVPSHPVAQRLLRACGRPLAAPSANRFGGISPTLAAHVSAEFSGFTEVAGVLDAGPCDFGVESTVVGFPGGDRVVIYRLGATPLEELREVVDGIEWVRIADAVDDPDLVRRGERSPGMLARHYAPRTPLRLLEAEAPAPAPDGRRRGWLSPLPRQDLVGPAEWLSENGNLRQAAARLFAALRRLDEAGVDEIIAWKVPETGLGLAINDRLSRAALPAD